MMYSLFCCKRKVIMPMPICKGNIDDLLELKRQTPSYVTFMLGHVKIDQVLIIL